MSREQCQVHGLNAAAAVAEMRQALASAWPRSGVSKQEAEDSAAVGVSVPARTPGWRSCWHEHGGAGLRG